MAEEELDPLKRIEDGLNERGLHVPVRTGDGVYYPRGTVGAGPAPETANAFLINKNISPKAQEENEIKLWVYDFSIDYSATGVEAQSRLKKDFYPRFFTQPRYLVKGQCANQYMYQKLGKFIRRGQIQQVSHRLQSKDEDISSYDLFTLVIEGGLKVPGRTMRGDHSRYVIDGYIEKMDTGGERFTYAPEYEFTFVVSNKREGPTAGLDTTVTPSDIKDVQARFLRQFAEPVKNPKIALPPQFRDYSQEDEIDKSADKQISKPPTDDKESEGVIDRLRNAADDAIDSVGDGIESLRSLWNFGD